MSLKNRIDLLTRRLRARTNHEGKPLPGYKENVASIRAELAQLTERMGINEDGE